MCRQHIKFFHFVLLSQLSFGANLDSPFAVDPDELQLKEISDNVRKVSGAVMGLAEYVLDIRRELKSIRVDIIEARSPPMDNSNSNSTSRQRPNSYYNSKPIRDPEELRRQSLALADKVERLLAMDQSPEVDLAKEELRKTVEKNFLRMLAAILVTGPAHAQDRSEDIFKLMRAVLNNEIDFNPVVQKLPLILRDSETNQFVNLLITLRESERGSLGSGGSYRLGLTSSTEVIDGERERQIYTNFPSNTNQQFYNPAQHIPQYISGTGQFISNVPINNNNNNVNVNNLRPPPNNNANYVTYVPSNINSNNLQTISSNNNGVNTGGVVTGAGVGVVGANNQNLNNNNVVVATTASPTSNQLPSINSIIDGINQTNQLLKEIPNLVEGLQTLVESLEGIFGGIG